MAATACMYVTALVEDGVDGYMQAIVSATANPLHSHRGRYTAPVATSSTPSRRRAESSVPSGRALQDKWSRAPVAERYAGERWRKPAAEARDGRLVARLLTRHGLSVSRVLDMPCGSGRLAPTLHPFATDMCGADASRAMLLEARAAFGRHALKVPHVQALAQALPFATGSCELVVCCRLLHHLDDGEQLSAVARELVRVAGTWIIASYWDCASLESMARGLRTPRPGGTRRSRPASIINGAFAAAGATVVDRVHARRLFSPQTFVLARKEPRPTHG
ncbi:MAG: hypothetical protein CMK00_09230 [Planctomycetes bacterium]|nr:hypothetical protein [Planctomycetota bacterium]